MGHPQAGGNLRRINDVRVRMDGRPCRDGDYVLAQCGMGFDQQQGTVHPTGKRHRKAIEGFQDLNQPFFFILKQSRHNPFFPGLDGWFRFRPDSKKLFTINM